MGEGSDVQLPSSISFCRGPPCPDQAVIHVDVIFRKITVFTSRQGMGVTGGNPYGFEVGRYGGVEPRRFRGGVPPLTDQQFPSMMEGDARGRR